MIKKELPEWKSVHTIIFDFDGIFTNNLVFVDTNGLESVCCNRSDGLGFDILRAFISINLWDLDYFILSKEKNSVVKKRADKMGLKCYHGISRKIDFIKSYIYEKKFNNGSEGLIYLGNDLNDLSAMDFAGYSVSPIDGHSLIKKKADLVINKKGGEGFVREFIEKIIRIDSLTEKELCNLTELL